MEVSAGNVDSVIDSTQKVVASYRYETFGRLMVKSGSLNQPYQFSTKRYLADVGLHYYGYRFYNSSIGRWMNRDPIGEEGGINLYNFVQNSPVNLYDQFGLSFGGCFRSCFTLQVPMWMGIVSSIATLCGAVGIVIPNPVSGVCITVDIIIGLWAAAVIISCTMVCSIKPCLRFK